MPALRALKATVTAVVRLAPAALQRHSPHAAADVGAVLAREVDAWVQNEKLGYYPALGFFEGRDLLSAGAVDALDQLAWLATSLVREEAQARLRPIFAGVSFQSVQALAYSMPPVRPHRPGAPDRLAAHYTPDRVKFTLRVTLFRRSVGNDGVCAFARQAVYRHLQPAFERIEITSVTSVE